MAYLYNRFCKGVKNNVSSTTMTWWKTNFNMPVPDIYDNTTNWLINSGPFIYYGTATTFDLTGFNNGWEAILGVGGIHWTGNEGGGLSHTFKQVWKNNLGVIVFTNNYNMVLTNLGVGFWSEGQIVSNQGVAPWEISGNGTYSCTLSVTGPNINLSTVYPITIINHPGFTGYKVPGYLWVEYEKLCYVSANGFIHKIVGTGTTAIGITKKGHIWLNTSPTQLQYISNLGIKKYCPLKIKQFASFFYNGASGAVLGQVPGYLWVDSEFGSTHLSYIDASGQKILTGDGHNPYITPY